MRRADSMRVESFSGTAELGESLADPGARLVGPGMRPIDLSPFWIVSRSRRRIPSLVRLLREAFCVDSVAQIQFGHQFGHRFGQQFGHQFGQHIW